MEIKTFEYEVEILESHLDTFGHVNNATYLTLYEQARWELITSNGWGLNRIQKELKGPIITNINISYLREVKLREKIVIQTRFKDFVNPKVCRIEQKMIDKDGKVKNLMIMEAGFFDLKERRLLDPNDEWMNSIGVSGDWHSLRSSYL